MMPDTGYRFDLHLVSSQLVKVEEKVFICALLTLLEVIETVELRLKIPEEFEKIKIIKIKNK